MLQDVIKAVETNMRAIDRLIIVQDVPGHVIGHITGQHVVTIIEIIGIERGIEKEREEAKDMKKNEENELVVINSYK